MNVSDGFNEARATSARFRADGTRPLIEIFTPAATERLTAGERTLVAGQAFDDRRRPLRDRSMRWFAGQRRGGRGARARIRLQAGRQTLRLVGRDHTGRRGVARVKVNVLRQRLRLLRLSVPPRVRHGARTVTVRIHTSAPAALRVGRRRLRVSRRTRRIVLRLPRRPVVGVLSIQFTMTPRSPESPVACPASSSR